MPEDPIVESLERLEQNGAGTEALLDAAVGLLHDSSPRFDWTGVYLLGPDGVLRLGPFRGEPTEHTEIPVGRGICGTAVAEERDLNVPDVTQVDNYLACSARTRSELVVLIRRGDEILGQIDIDSHAPGPFGEDDVSRVRRVADWLAARLGRREAGGGPASAP